MATGTGNLPNPSMSFSPFAILTAEQMNNLVSNINSLATGTGIGDGSVNTAAIADGAVTTEKVASGFCVQSVSFQTGAVATGSTAMLVDDTIPQSNEGDQFMSLAITPLSATNRLVIEITAHLTSAVADKFLIGALFQDSTANALAAIYNRVVTTSGIGNPLTFTHTMVAGTTSATTFKFRGGANTATVTFNGSGGNRIFGGVMASSIVIREYKV